jgi:hypothetical protein
MGLEYERKYLSPQGGEFHPQGGMPTLIRYMTANRRAFDKSLQMLIERRAQNEAARQAAEDDSDALEPTPVEPCGTGAPSGAGGNPLQLPANVSAPDGDSSALAAARDGEARRPRPADDKDRSKEREGVA